MRFKDENQITEFQKLLFNNPFTFAMEEIKENYNMGFISMNECRHQLLDAFLITFHGVKTNTLKGRIPEEIQTFIQGMELNSFIGKL